jgi:hypothetical protein
VHRRTRPTRRDHWGRQPRTRRWQGIGRAGGACHAPGLVPWP